MNNKRIAVAGIVAIVLVAFLAILFSQFSAPTGQSVLRFTVCGNGSCGADENYQTCAEDCCDNDCTAKGDSVCHAECGSYAGSTCSVSSGCNGITFGQPACADSTHYVTCCGETPTACAPTTSCVGGLCVPCSVACDENSDCVDDGNSLTVEICSNPGACDANCLHTPCSVACNGNAGCNDNNALTTDVCNNPGACDANCTHTACSVACNGNAGCNDNNTLTTDVCVNPGACDANCTHNAACSVRCGSDSACNDNNALTADVCVRPGACDSNCTNAACSIACGSNSACNDNNSLTTDVCLNPGLCSASCSNAACSIACYVDANCIDSNPLTIDKCNNPSTCDANCSHSACVVACNGDGDCFDFDPATTDKCVNPGDCNSICSNNACAVACNADGECDDSDAATLDKCENSGTCNASCAHSALPETGHLSIEFVGDFNKQFVRGDVVDLKLLVKDEEGNVVSDAVVSLTDPNGNEVSLNSAGNGYYTGQYTVSFDFPVGLQQFSFSAEKGGRKGAEELALDVNKGAIKAILLLPAELKADVGEKIEFRFRLVYDNNSPVGKADVNAVLNGISIPLQFDGNVFTGYYLFSERDVGDANLLISAVDSFANSGTTAFAFAVEQPLQLFAFFPWLILLIVLLIALYSLYRLRRLFSLEHRRGKLVVAKRRALLQKAVVKGKGRKAKLQKQIAGHEKELHKTGEEISVERKRHVIAWRRLPSELRYAAHKALVGFSLLPGKTKQLFLKPKGIARAVERRKRLSDIDSEVAELRERILNLETEFCKQTIKEDYFRQKLFEFREKIHFLELEKTKLS